MAAGSVAVKGRLELAIFASSVYRIVPNFSAEQNAGSSRHLGIVGLRWKHDGTLGNYDD